jgi:hypothetical protein
MSTHTPGPWKYDDFYVVAAGEDEDVICEVWVTHKANAALIAAAPEMLEALKLSYPLLECSDEGEAATAAILAVIAKAEGRE